MKKEKMLTLLKTVYLPDFEVSKALGIPNRYLRDHVRRCSMWQTAKDSKKYVITLDGDKFEKAKNDLAMPARRFSSPLFFTLSGVTLLAESMQTSLVEPQKRARIFSKLVSLFVR